MKLILDDGSEFSGSSAGVPRAVAGEVVFNTGMTGYVEALTDPSYRGQILVLTYPLVGNYGVPGPRAADSLDRPYESSQIQVQGLVVQHMIHDYSHHSAERSLADWLASENVPYISGVDTRTLTRKLREQGTMLGRLLPAEETGQDVQYDSVDMEDELFRLVAPPEAVVYPGGDLRVLLIDVGCKDNIARSLLQRGVTVVRVPWFDDLQEHVAQADGIVIGNGPGNPKHLTSLIEQLSTVLQQFDKPVFGICLGHQILALAAGADTFKLPYGHRSVNQPVEDQLTRRYYITSQNHGYAVDDHSLPGDWEPWFVNINDGTNEGIRSLRKPYFSVQFHPESHPGPKDTAFLFDDFVRQVGAFARP
ncbi:MAG: glutamine-hydrolyzing carbamoyl-phosphate synthase small subunit [Xanthomonadales bacterium]|nr:glutamine-hydrolyzing carbamoyl-phosphate synthase small subunit [Xanthomonadales bacterium]